MIRVQNKKNVEEILAVQALVLEGFATKFSHVGFRKEQIEELLFYLWSMDESENLQYVATREENVLGTMLLKRVNEKEKLDVSIFTLWKKFGLWKTLKFIDTLEILSHHVEKNEVYIDHIVIHPDARGQQLGTSLIEQAKKTLVGNEYLSLFVAKSNIKAFDLYSRLGFEMNAIVKDERKGKAVGETDWFYMIFQGK